MAPPILFIGNKNYSSWSMRPWLALTWAGLHFEERVIPLGGVGYGKSRIPAVLEVSASGRVPALHVGEARIHDSLAICEWAHDVRPERHLWPADPIVRAQCRAVACEMHAGFAALRKEMPMNIRRAAGPRALSEEALGDVARVQEIWRGARAQFGQSGPYLFGARTIADAFFAPVCTRFRTYSTPLDAVSLAYCEAVFADSAFRAWEKAAELEPWTIPQTDAV